jgi:hypothetical protein
MARCAYRTDFTGSIGVEKIKRFSSFRQLFISEFQFLAGATLSAGAHDAL